MTEPVPGPDVSHLVTEDGAPVDNIITEKQYRLLTEPLYTSWGGPPPREGAEEPRTFVAMANVGLFAVAKNPAIVPDVLLSADVELPPDTCRPPRASRASASRSWSGTAPTRTTPAAGCAGLRSTAR